MVAGKDITEVQVNIAIIPETGVWVALENVGEHPTMYCAVCRKFQSKANKTKRDN